MGNHRAGQAVAAYEMMRCYYWTSGREDLLNRKTTAWSEKLRPISAIKWLYSV